MTKGISLSVYGIFNRRLVNFYKLEHPPLETAEVKYPKIHALNIPAVLRVGAAALGFCALTFPTAKTAETHPEPESKVRIFTRVFM